VTKKTLMLRILEFLREYSGATIKDISSSLGISMSLARTVIYRLRNNGYIEKAGKGYILTEKGEWFVNKFGEPRKTIEESGTGEKEIVQTVKDTAQSLTRPSEQTMVKAPSKPVEKIMEQEKRGKASKNVSEELVRTIEQKIAEIEKEIKTLENTIAKLKEELEKTKEELRKAKLHGKRGIKKEEKGLPKPIMPINEAMSILGSLFNTLVYQGKIEVVGKLAVDKEYYDEFIKKFPLPVRDAEKLSPMEKTLLEEMKRDARVILYAGKEYRLV